MVSLGGSDGLGNVQETIGRYRILDKLGQGGTCRVFRVFDPEHQRTCALKVLLDNANVLRFKREFRSMARLDHPNIAKVYEFGESGQDVFFTMEFIEGGDLKSWFRTIRTRRRERSFPESEDEFREIIDLFCRICDPLQYIHLQHIVHRDLKPANIMLTADNRVKLMDFGLVKESELMDESLTRTGMFIGTVAYMSPEQGMGRSLDHRSDLYSLGIILYEACTGRIPFQGENVLNIFMQHIRDVPEPPRKINPAVPIPLDRLIMKLLEKQPIDRFNSAADLVADLHGVYAAVASETTQEEVIPALSDTTTETGRASDTHPLLLAPGLIGRDHELTRIRNRLDHLSGRGAGVVLIQGEAGMGKSALIRETASGARIRKCAVMRSVCSEVERYPYSAFVPVLEAIAEKLSAMPSDDVLRFLQGRGEILASICPRFLDIPAMHGHTLPAALEPAQQKIRAFDAIKTLLFSYAASRPVVVCIDDLQWADELSIELLHYLARVLCEAERGQARPVLFIAGYRKTELRDNDTFWHHHERILSYPDCEEFVLSPLDVRATRQMVRAMLGAGQVSAGILDRVYRESGGNPFFIEEILRLLIEDESLSLVQGQWTPESTSDDASAGRRFDSISGRLTRKIPDRLNRMISRRVAGLSEKTREVLSRASVIGGQFEFEMLLRLCDVSEDDLLDHLDEAIRMNILEDAPGSIGKALRFTQNLICKMLYDGLSNLRRNRLHQKVAETIIALHGPSSEPHIEVLAYHFDHAQQFKPAIEYYSRAARLDLTHSIANAACAHADRILALLPHARMAEDQRVAAHLNALGLRGESYEMMGKFESAMTDFSTIFDLAAAHGEAELQAKALRSKGRLHVKLGDHEAAMEAFQQSLNLMPDMPETASERAYIDANIALVWLNLGEAQKALELFIMLRKKIHDLDPPVAAMCDSNIGLACYYLGDYPRALESLQNAVDRYHALNEPNQILKVMNNIAGIHMARGDTAQVLSTNMQSLALARKIGDIHSIAVLLGNLALIHQEHGDYVLASEHFRESLEISRSNGDKVGIAIALINVGNMMMDLGNEHIPEQNYTSAYEIAEETGERWLAVIAMHQMGEFRIIRHSLERAESILIKCRDDARQIGLRTIEVQSAANLGYIRAIRDRSAAAIEIAQQALNEAKQIGDMDGVLRTLWRLSAIQLLFGAPDKAIRTSVEGLNIARKREYRMYEWRFWAQAGDALLALDRRKPAYRALSRGAYVLEYLADNTTADDRRTFFRTPDVASVLDRLQFLADAERDSMMAALCRRLLDPAG